MDMGWFDVLFIKMLHDSGEASEVWDSHFFIELHRCEFAQ